MRAIFLLFASLVLAACSNDLADSRCDIGQAATVVYDGSGQPYFAGQALVIGSCGPCHDSVTDTTTPNAFVSRNGAPIDLSWDLDYRAVSAETMRTGVHTTVSNRDGIWGSVSSGHMPPTHTPTSPTDPATGVTARGFAFADGSPLPTLRDAAGKEILRNWLACRAPVVQGAPMAAGAAVSDAFGNFVDCHTSTGSCVLDPTWNDHPNSIYPGLIVQHCLGSGCHSDASPVSNLHLTEDDPHGAYTQLVGSVSMSPGCSGTLSVPGAGCSPTDLIRIVPGNADCSLIVAKLKWHFPDGSLVCGPTMPLSASHPLAQDVYVDPLVQWINEGAIE